MPGMSIHVVDVSCGVVAAGMAVEVYALGADGAARREIASGALGNTGTLADPRLGATFAPGQYEAVFHVADYYRKAGLALPAVPFLEVVTYRFGISDASQHYHLPFKCTPWGFSCFRGGA